MLRMDEYETSVMANLIREMLNCKDKDQINKLYRQGRIWIRFHWIYGGACTKEKRDELLNTLNTAKNDAYTWLERSVG